MITKDKITEIFCILRVDSARILMPKCKAIHFHLVFKSLAEAVRLVILYLFYKFRERFLSYSSLQNIVLSISTTNKSHIFQFQKESEVHKINYS